MKFRVATEIPMSAREFWDTIHTPELDAFLTKEYGVIQRDQDGGPELP